MATERKRKTTPRGRKPALDAEVTEDAIRERAYQISQRRGGEPGRELDDWLQAERELRGDGKRG